MHKLSSSFVLGYHGCDRAVAEQLLAGTPFNASDNGWDWLGTGVYFWEANPVRGLEFAHLLAKWRMGNLGFCLDLMSSTGIQAVASVYADFIAYCKQANIEIPQNEGGDDAVYRRLDCAVINHLHTVRSKKNFLPFDTVRGVFVEGGRIYEGSGFRKKTHVQICVCNLTCIKGVFRVPDDQLA